MIRPKTWIIIGPIINRISSRTRKISLYKNNLLILIFYIFILLIKLFIIYISLFLLRVVGNYILSIYISRFTFSDRTLIKLLYWLLRLEILVIINLKFKIFYMLGMSQLTFLKVFFHTYGLVNLIYFFLIIYYSVFYCSWLW